MGLPPRVFTPRDYQEFAGEAPRGVRQGPPALDDRDFKDPGAKRETACKTHVVPGRETAGVAHARTKTKMEQRRPFYRRKRPTARRLQSAHAPSRGKI